MLIGLGAVLIVVGLIFSITIIGAIIGIPMILAGASLCFWGAVLGRKTVIQNVITVSNAPVQAAPPPAPRLGPEQGQIEAVPVQQIEDGSQSRAR